jgi:hypothetical protein
MFAALDALIHFSSAKTGRCIRDYFTLFCRSSWSSTPSNCRSIRCDLSLVTWVGGTNQLWSWTARTYIKIWSPQTADRLRERRNGICRVGTKQFIMKICQTMTNELRTFLVLLACFWRRLIHNGHDDCRPYPTYSLRRTIWNLQEH